MSPSLGHTDTESSLDTYHSLPDLQLAPISRLYSLPPIGVGTGLVESLTSYMARLAHAHRITPGQLFTKQILPLIGELPPELRIGRLPSTFGGYNRFFNGCGKPAEFVTAALAKLTLRSDLLALSMLRWRNAISPISLSRKVRAWCARCFSDRRTNGIVLFEALLWTINLVTACPVHNCTLTTECPACGKRSAPLEGRLRIGYCAKCGAWLGQRAAPAPIENSTSNRDLQPEFISSQLLEALRLVDDPVDRSTTAARVEILVRNRGWSNAAWFKRAANLQPQELSHIRNGRRPTSLKTLLSICRATEINLHDLLGRQAAIFAVQPSARRTSVRLRRKWRHKGFVDAIRTKLEAAAREACPT